MLHDLTTLNKLSHAGLIPLYLHTIKSTGMTAALIGEAGLVNSELLAASCSDMENIAESTFDTSCGIHWSPCS